MPEALSTVLGSLSCPKCGGEIPAISIDVRPTAATNFDDCLRKCGSCCSVGASNGQNPTAVTYIFKDPIEAIPVASRAGAAEVAQNALNVRNRRSKWTRFGFMPTSEDAVTWVVFSHLHEHGQLVEALARVGVQKVGPANAPPTLLLWGVPVGDTQAGTRLARELKRECVKLGENPRSLSEPDVVFDLGNGTIVFVEVKHRSPNDSIAASDKRWGKYLNKQQLGWSPDTIRESGCYELARNWRLAYELSHGKEFHLVNLGSNTLFSGPEGRRLDRFAAALGTNRERQFHRATWDQFLDGPWPQVPDWLKTFCIQWGVTSLR